jgi:hypothetical protein
MALSGMLAVRVHALWGLKPRIKYFIATCWVVSSAYALSLSIRFMIWMMREIARVLTPLIEHLMSFHVCFLQHTK